MWPAGFEPAARRVSGDRSTRLSYGHGNVGARVDSLRESVAEPNLFGESSDAPGREDSNQKGAHGGNWFPP